MVCFGSLPSLTAQSLDKLDEYFSIYVSLAMFEVHLYCIFVFIKIQCIFSGCSTCFLKPCAEEFVGL